MVNIEEIILDDDMLPTVNQGSGSCETSAGLGSSDPRERSVMDAEIDF